MAEELRVRTLKSGDVAALRGLMEVFGRAFEDPVTYGGHPPSDEYLETLLASALFVAVAVFAEGQVVGGLAGYALPKFEQARTEFYIYDLAVAEEYRRRGVATRALEELGRVVRERGIYVVFVQADYGDDAAIALYTKRGTREEVLHFDLDL
jgi:aminoglycoside 3-N-acetyltransferase I